MGAFASSQNSTLFWYIDSETEDSDNVLFSSNKKEKSKPVWKKISFQIYRDWWITVYFSSVCPQKI